jgi:PAS domain S-box-containing protein
MSELTDAVQNNANPNRNIFHATESLRENKDLYKHVVESIKDHAIILTDANGLIVSWNSGAENLTGFSAADAIGSYSSIIFTPEDVADGADKQEMSTAKIEGKAEDSCWHIKKSGERFFANGILNPLLDDDENVIGYIKVLRDFTLQHQSEIDLRQTKTSREFALEAAEMGDWDYSYTTNVARTSLKHDQIYGYTNPVANWNFDNFYSHVIPADHEIVHKHFQDLQTTGVIDIEYRIKRVDGEVRWISLKGRGEKDKAGKTVRIAGVVRDIHDQKTLQEQLAHETEETEAAHEELYELVMQAPTPMVVMTGPEFRFTFTNPLYETLVGRRVQGKNLRDVFKQSELGGMLSIIEAVYNTGEPHAVSELPFTLKSADGKTKQLFLNVSYTALRDSKNSIKAVTCLMIDITKEVVARNEAILERGRFETLMRKMPAAVIIAEAPSGKILFANDQMQSVWGHEYGEWKGWHLDGREILPNEWPLARAISSGEEVKGEHVRVLWPNGQERFLNLSAAPVRDPHNNVIAGIAICQDISDEVNTKKNLEATKERLQRAAIAAESASAAKSSFLANMSHEIRTPMTAVLGFTEVLRDPDLTVEERSSALSRIDSSGRALLRLIEDILDISRIEAGKLDIQQAPFSPASVVTDVISLLRLSAEQKNLQLKLRIDSSVPSIATSDPARLRQILMNLIGNAIKFTERGEVIVKLKSTDNQFLLFDIVDTGIGIADCDRDKLFQPFAQADGSITRKFGSSGLGLILSRRLAERLGGDLWLAESTQHKGSRFTVKIKCDPFTFDRPDLVNNEEAAMAAAGASSKKDLIGYKILVAEDVVENRELIKIYLNKAGAQVDFAEDGSQAIEKANANSYNIILMDIQMPNVDGIQATKILRANGYEKPIVALTAHAMAEEAIRSLDSGCNAHLTKPLDRFGLIAAIKKYASLPV